MGRMAHAYVRPGNDHQSVMSDSTILHRIEDDLSGAWIEEWAEDGVRAIESYLAKHLAFLSFLDEASA